MGDQLDALLEQLECASNSFEALVTGFGRLTEENERLRAALGKIANTGQSIEPDHWKFRCMAREIASAALCTNKGGE